MLSRRVKRGRNGSEPTVWTVKGKENALTVRFMQVTGKSLKYVFDIARHYIWHGQMVDERESCNGENNDSGCFVVKDGM